MRVWPGWHVYVNGRPAEIKPFLELMPAVRISAGTSKVEYRCRPWSWWIGGALSLLGVATLLMMAAWPHRALRKVKEDRK